MSRMERLSALDTGFLDLEHGSASVHIGALAVFEGPAPSQHDVAERYVHRFASIPRTRQRLRRDPLRLRRPAWDQDPHFDLSYHLRRTALASPGEETELMTAVGRLMSVPLDEERPLWEAYVIEGLADGRWAVLTKIHHCALDGQAGMNLFTALLDETPPHRHPRPRRVALTPLQRLTRTPSRILSAPARLGAPVREVLRNPMRTVTTVRRAGHGAGNVALAVRPAPGSALAGPIHLARRFRVATLDLDDIHTVREAFGGTGNDVALTLVTRAVRGLLEHRGEPADVHTVRCLVPRSLRLRTDSGVSRNLVSGYVVDLPTEFSDITATHEAMTARMRAAKRSDEPEALAFAERIADRLPAPLVSTAVRLVTWMPHRLIDTVVTNVPGPAEPVHLLGRQLLALYPYVPIADTVRIAFAVTSYAGRLYVGITCDRESTPDAEILAAGLPTALDELVKLAHDGS